MKKSRTLAILLLMGGAMDAGDAWATSATGTMAVSVTVASSINMVFTTDASGLTLTNSNSSAVTAAFGTMQAYGGTTPTGVTKTLLPAGSPTTWKISTPFDVTVQLANQTSSNYTLTAQLQTLDTTNTWAIGGTTVPSSSTITLTSTGAYATAVPYTFSLTIPFSEAATTINNTINFTATAN